MTNIHSYIPFEHSNLAFAQGMIGVARKQDTNTVEGALSSTLIYINAIDYISSHLLEHMGKISHMVTYNELDGVVFSVEVGLTSLPLGKLVNELEKFEFPDKVGFIQDLKQFTIIRNRVAHRLIGLTQKELDRIDRDLEDLRKIAEGLLSRYDTIARGVTNNWLSYLRKLNERRISDETPKTDTTQPMQSDAEQSATPT